MKNVEYQDGETNFKELLAMILRRGRLLIVFTLFFSLLLGSFGALNYYVLSEDPDREYNIELEAHEQEIHLLEATIKQAELSLKHQKEYNNSSPLMKIDPYNKYVTSHIFAISHIVTGEVEDDFAIYETPVSYMTARITAQYAALWNQMELSKIVAGTSYEGIEDKYLREVIFFSVGDGGTLNLSAISNDPQECETIINRLCDFFTDNLPTVSATSYQHELISLSNIITSNVVDLELESIQQNNRELLISYTNTVASTKKSILQLEQNMPSYTGGLKSVVVNMIVGAVVGFLLVCICLVISQLVNKKVTGEKNLVASFEIECFGSIATASGFWNRIANRVLGERVWKTEQQAYDYIAEKAALHLPETGKIAVISTMETVDSDKIQNLIGELSAPGREIVFACDLSHNSKALTAIRESDGIVLTEQAYVTSISDVLEALSEFSKLDKTVYGVVLI